MMRGGYFSTSGISTTGKLGRTNKTRTTVGRSLASIASVNGVKEPKFSTSAPSTVRLSGDVSVAIIVDSREPYEILSLLPEDATVVLLEYGDYLFITPKLSVGVERKTVADLLGSLGNGRLDRQVAGLCAAYDVPILLIQGDILPGYTGKVKVKGKETGWNYNAVMNWLLTFQEYGVRLASCPDSIEWLIRRLNSIREFYSHGEHTLKPRVEVPVGKSKYSASELALSQVPGIGLDRAKKLHRHFGSLWAVVNADEEQLRYVPGIGPKVANELYRTFRASEDTKRSFSSEHGYQPDR